MKTVELRSFSMINWNAEYINLENLRNTARGNHEIFKKHLRLFLELVPNRIEKLNQALDNSQLDIAKGIIHKMRPQLQYFGTPSILQTLRRLEFEYESLPEKDLRFLLDELSTQLQVAQQEISRVLEQLDA